MFRMGIKRCISKGLCLASILFFTFASGQGVTYVEPTGLQLTCYAPHAVTGDLVPVLGVNGNLGGFWGFATYDGYGWPVMIFDVFQLSHFPLIVSRYVYYHECAHLSIPTLNEVTASCVGLINMRRNGHIDELGENTLRLVVESLVVLPPQYGGSGKVLWDATLNCANQ